jgi:hypothetical protein
LFSIINESWRSFGASPRLAASVLIYSRLHSVKLATTCSQKSPNKAFASLFEQTCNASSPSAEARLPLLRAAVEEHTKGRPQVQVRVLRCYKFPGRGMSRLSEDKIHANL